ncbi:NADH:ubiquinone oxidoreductase [Linnemannia schmuckeri]|uniref:NADH:ubiquinone oxidoreductase n=1 Tax=Linnemannia schmuckeri TaxID=64567 RepID=A0A9P5VBB7_9FUNG|nr:NADH:ubiquinone oxidoreductase [Linnemannia schmuckeri]
MSEEPQSFSNVADELEYYKNLARKNEDELLETRAMLEDFQLSSRELEEELEKEIDSTERRYNEIRIRNEAMKQEVEDWKEKYHQAVKDSNANINQLSRQLEVLKQQTAEFIKTRRELEQENDHLERTERAATWSMQEITTKYDAAVERVAILENEVSTKASLSEEVQRLKDELRDANVELEIMKANQKAGLDRSNNNLSSYSGSTSSLVEGQSPRPAIGSNYEAMPSLRARLANNSALQRSASRLASSGSPTAKAAAGVATGPAPGHNPVQVVQDMVGRVKSLEARLVSCRSLVTPLLQPPPSYSTTPSTGRNSWQGSQTSTSTTGSDSTRLGSPSATSPSSLLTSPKVSRRTSLLLQQHLQQHREQREQQKLREQQRVMAMAESAIAT